MAEKGPINFSRFMRHFPTTVQMGRDGNMRPRDRSRVVHVLLFAEEVAVRPPKVEMSGVEWRKEEKRGEE